jgi:hypothetical protein
MADIDYNERGQLINRLASQVGSRQKAITILQKRGHLKADGKTLTEEGMKRNAMTAQERAVDRGSKRFNVDGNSLLYNPFTNKANKNRL